jgi:hypothetical protein
VLVSLQFRGGSSYVRSRVAQDGGHTALQRPVGVADHLFKGRGKRSEVALNRTYQGAVLTDGRIDELVEFTPQPTHAVRRAVLEVLHRTNRHSEIHPTGRGECLDLSCEVKAFLQPRLQRHPREPFAESAGAVHDALLT